MRVCPLDWLSIFSINHPSLPPSLYGLSAWLSLINANKMISRRRRPFRCWRSVRTGMPAFFFTLCMLLAICSKQNLPRRFQSPYTHKSAKLISCISPSSLPLHQTPQVNPGTCSDNTPCGWAVYTRFTRVVDYFMKNTCTCKTGLECIRVDDDVSVSAYIYKCREVPNRNSKGGDGATSW